MVYEAGKKLSREEIDLFENPRNIREIQYLGVRLVDEQCEYDPKEVAGYAIKKGHASRLGYLAEISLEAAKNLETEKNINLTKKTNRVNKLIELLYPHRNKDYGFLFSCSNKNDNLNRILNKLDKDRSTQSVNKRWKIYSAIHHLDIEEYIELYLIDLRQGNYVRLGIETMRTR